MYAQLADLIRSDITEGKHKKGDILPTEKELGDLIKLTSSDAGMHLIAWLQKDYNDLNISKKAKENKLLVYPLSEYVLKFKQKPGLLLGYTAFDKLGLKEGVQKLKRILN